MNTKTNYRGKNSKVAWLLGIIAGFVPLIVRLKAMKVPVAAKEIWDNGTGLYADFFSANKVIVLAMLTMIAFILFSIEYKEKVHSTSGEQEKFFHKNKLVIILLGAYLGLAVLSTLFSDSSIRVVALLGIPGRYEGLITMLFYVTIMILAIYLGQDWWNIKVIYRVLRLGAFILAAIGVLQFFGWDLLQSDGGKALMLPFKYQDQASNINFAFAGRVYATLFNPNYVGSYTAMLMPISLTAVIYTYLYVKNKGKKVTTTIIALLMFALWFTCYSRGGLLGGSFSLLILLVTLYKHFIKTKGQLGILLILIGVGVVGLNFASEGVILKRIQSLPQQAAKFMSSEQASVPQLTDIRLEDRALEVDSNLPTFRVELKEDHLVMKDEQGNLIDLKEKDKQYTPDNEDFPGMNMKLLSEDQFTITIRNPQQNARYSLYLAHTPLGLRVVGHNNGLYEVVDIPSWGFEGKERLGSSRGYIWSRTIPMIRDKWVLGHGLDTFSLVFPQHDIVGKINAYGRTNIITDKPHNLYLQAMVSTGLPSMLILMAIFVIYCIQWIRHLRITDKDDISRWMSIGIFAAICGYLVAGFFNDSVVSVAPVFWILWGLGIGLTSSSSSRKKVQ